MRKWLFKSDCTLLFGDCATSNHIYRIQLMCQSRGEIYSGYNKAF